MRKSSILVASVCFCLFRLPVEARDMCSFVVVDPARLGEQNYNDFPPTSVGVEGSSSNYRANIGIGQANYDIMNSPDPHFFTLFFDLGRGDVIPIRDDSYRITALSKDTSPGYPESDDCISVEKTSVNLLDGQKNSIVLPQNGILTSSNDPADEKDIYLEKTEGENIFLIWQSRPQKGWPYTEKHHIWGRPFRSVTEHRVKLKIGEYFSIPGYGKLQIAKIVPAGAAHKIWIVMSQSNF